MIKNCGLNYQKRLEKVIELNGERLEPYHLEEIKKEMKEKKNGRTSRGKKRFKDEGSI